METGIVGDEAGDVDAVEISGSCWVKDWRYSGGSDARKLGGKMTGACIVDTGMKRADVGGISAGMKDDDVNVAGG